MKRFRLAKTTTSVHWKAGSADSAFSVLEMSPYPTEVIFQLTEGYVSDFSNRMVEKEAWMYMNAEDLEALANAALCMANTLRNGGAS